MKRNITQYSSIKLNKQNDLKGQHNFILFDCVYMWADPATFLASNCVLGTYFSPENDLSFNKYFGVCIITS